MRKLRGIIWVVIVAVLVQSPITSAAGQKSEGLSISPLRQEVAVEAGKTTPGFVTVGNLTDKQMIVDLSVREFSVTDYDYDYEFKFPPQRDWVRLRQQSFVLEPHKTANAWYDVTIPDKTTPGGYYFSIFASTKVESTSGLPGTIQAVTPLYMKVDGDLIRTGVLQNDSIPFLVTGYEVPYKFDVKNTGNVHFTAYFYGQLGGLLFGQQPEVGEDHLLMPGKIRTVEGTIPTPLLPGIYKVTYGYKVDFASITTVKTGYILFIPPWSIIALVLFFFAIRWMRQRRQQLAARKKDKSTDS